ncbi:MAG: PAS domain-containing protein [Xanthomonadales bacterium]|nr:PAS domain-containing protein [Xanthomonadales bacterium]
MSWLTLEVFLTTVFLLVLVGGFAWWRARAWWRRQQSTLAELRDSEERLLLALRSSRDELWDLNLASGHLTRVNALTEVELAPEVRFQSLDDYLMWVHPDDRERMAEPFIAHLKGQTDFYEASYRIRGRVGGDFSWVLSRGQAVTRDPRGRALRLVGTNRDVSEILARDMELERLNRDLTEIKGELEKRVEERTRALKQSNHELEFTLDELKLAQNQLVESEKMAALGGLVAGIAHEINTPLGISVTAASHLQTESTGLVKQMQAGTMKRSDLQRFEQEVQTSAQLILKNLERASRLIRSFKQVAVDQSSEMPREVVLDTYLDEILLSMHPVLKKTGHQVAKRCATDLKVLTYAGAISQIVVNLLMNSVEHGYPEGQAGQITLHCEGYDAEWLLLYRDDGQGMSEEVRQRVFEPFFTTRRGQGGSGLGMHIVYNLVTQLLGGSIDLLSKPGEGVEVQIQLPRRVPVPETGASGGSQPVVRGIRAIRGDA